MEIKNYKLKNNIQVTHIITDKFKTNSITLLIHNKLEKTTASKNALIPMVLRRGSKTIPTMQELSIKLEELYGSSLSVNISKKGEIQILQFCIDFINDKFLKNEESLFEQCAKILNEVVTDPLLKNGVFNEEYVEQEKQNLINKIETRINDKVQYAVERLYQLMCKDEPYGISELGDIEDIKNITSETLTNQYKKILKDSQITIIVVGDVEEKRIKNLENIINLNPQLSKIDTNVMTKKAEKINEYEEKMDVTQSKLSIGLRIRETSKNDFYPLMMYTSILGGGSQSKLFRNVREKESLAYYASARLEKIKGTIAITSGIEPQNYKKAKNIILEQIEAIKQGDISQKEIIDSIQTLKNALISSMDEPYQIINYYLQRQLMNDTETPEEMVQKLSEVTKEQIIKVANDIELDTIYLINPKEVE